MDYSEAVNVYSQQLSDQEFRRIQEFMLQNLGIKLHPIKIVMVNSRLIKRLKATGIYNFTEYLDYALSPEGKRDGELERMIDELTTHKTEFFRESDHFTFLQNNILSQSDHTRANPFKIWSAGCSSGEEPYTMAMVLSDYAEQHPGFRFSIYASDISQRVLQTAVMAIYAESKIAPVPMEMRKKYLLRSKDKTKQLIRFAPNIRRLVSFDRINLMNVEEQVGEAFHVIFCRNVIIYFDRDTQESLLNKFAHKLMPGGYLFLGHSEALAGMQVPFRCVAPMVYRKI